MERGYKKVFEMGNPDKLIFDLIHSRRHNRLQNRYSNLKFLSIIGVEIFRHKTV
jgi:hypothetical protein